MIERYASWIKLYREGRVCILDSLNKQSLGRFEFNSQYCLKAQYRSYKGIFALKAFAAESIEKNNQDFHPEYIFEPHKGFCLNPIGTHKVVMRELKKFQMAYERSYKLRPPKNLGLRKLKIPIREIDLNLVDLDILDRMALESQVGRIYEISPWPYFETLLSLVKLRVNGYIGIFHTPLKGKGHEVTKAKSG